MGEPERNMGLTTICKVGVDLDTMMVLFQSSVITFGVLLDCARAMEPAQRAAGRIERETTLRAPRHAFRKQAYGGIKVFLQSVD